MPVVSPHRSGSSASTLPATYRSTYSSSSLVDRPYYGTTSGSSYVPRYNTTSYERYARASSILEDSATLSTRYHREECREVSVTRRSTLGDTSITTSSSTSASSNGASNRFGSIRENSILDLHHPRGSMVSGAGSREGSRDRSGSTAASSALESVADFCNKYSPNNYVPKVMRTRQNGVDSMSRSKTLGDIGLPPTKISASASPATANANPISNSTNTTSSSTTTTNGYEDTSATADETDQRMRSVSEIRRHFDRLSQSQERELSPKPTTTTTTTTMPPPTSATTAGFTVTVKNRPNVTATLLGLTNGVKSAECETNGESKTTTSVSSDDVLLTNGHNHTSDFASYIPCAEAVKNGAREEDLTTGGGGDATGAAAGSSSGVDPMDKPSRFHHQQKGPANVSGQGKQGNKKELSSAARNPTTATTTTATATSGRPSPDHLSTSAGVAGGATAPYTSSRAAAAASASAGGGGGLNGLKNIGNTCFMNSVLQCLSNTRPLLEYMRKDGYGGDINTTISGMKGALVKAFAQLIKDLWSDECVVNTASLKSQIQRFAPRFMGYSQQDAQEFLRYLLEGLHEDVNRVTIKPTPLTQDIDDRLGDSEKSQEAWQRYTRMDNSKIVDLFVGQLKSTLKCTHCGHCSVTFDPFWDLSLPIPQRTGQLRLSQCLDSFTREETLDGDEKPTCSKCKERRKCTKSFSIQRFPKILVIHLKRFSPMERFRGKLSCTVDFPLEGLDMSNYAADAKSSQCRYNLYAISNHSGTTYSGHYTAYCKHPYNGAWHEYNDSRVSTISARSLVSGEAYVLFYELDGTQRAHL